MGFFKLYFDLIASERQWSWSLMGIGYLALALFVRVLIFRGMVREAKTADSSLYSAVRGLYFKNSLAGWILFFISFLLVIVMWTGWRGAFTDPKLLVLFSFLLLILFFLSLILHLTAFARALLAVLRQRMGVEKEF